MEFLDSKNGNDSKKDFLELENDGNDYYILEKGTKIYRGDDNKIEDFNEYKPRFFGYIKDDVKSYGKIVYEFKVNNQLKLLAIDRNIDNFYTNAPENIQTILRENYGYKKEKQLRDSVKENDNILLHYLCDKKKYDGYATNLMEKVDNFDGSFPREIAICDNKKYNTPNIISDTNNKQQTKRLHDDAVLRRHNEHDKIKRKQNRRRYTKLGELGKIPTLNLFDSDEDEQNGGKKRKSKRKTVKKTTKPKFWRDMKPSKKGRKTYKKKYGSRCFLLPSQLKYPICDKKTGKMNCKGLLSANYRAALSIRRKLKPKTYSYRKITQKARKLAKKHKCNWVKSKSKSKSKSKIKE